MLFNSFEFLLLFLPAVLIVYYTLLRIDKIVIAKLWLVAASVFFYAWWNISYLPIIIGSITTNFIIGNFINHADSRKARKLLLSLGVFLNLAVLGYYKYVDFFLWNLNIFIKDDFEFLKLALPLAISFFTFQQIAYLVDTYRKETKEISFIDYVFFVSFFPQLIAGPIVHHKEIIPQLQNKETLRFNSANFSKGIYIFMIGLAKKVLVADSFAIWANQGYNMVGNLSMAEAWGATLAYTMQLYFDFSGYSDMAIGLGLLFNFLIPVNFMSPYRSLNIKEFWRRWHATLGRFFTQYLYIPLGGNRMGESRTLLNLFIIFLVSGIWHGAGWTFIIWGVSHGIATLVHRYWSSRKFSLPKGISWLITFLFVHFAWIFFRAESVSEAISIIKTMTNFSDRMIKWSFTNNGNSFLSIGEILGFSTSQLVTITIPFIIVFTIVLFAPSSIELLKRFRPNLISSLYMAFLLALLLYSAFENTGISEFLYFNF